MAISTNLYSLGANAFSAYRSGIAVAGNNVANATTPGYSRQQLGLRALFGPAAGVTTDALATRVASPWVAARERSASSDLGHSSSLASAALDLEGLVVPSTGNIVDAIGSFFGELGRLSASPADPALRRTAVGAASDLAAAFRSAARGVSQGISDADGRIAALTTEANALAGRIAQANTALRAAADPALLDARELAANRLAELTGGQARVDPDGMMRVVLDGGAVLVDGTRAATLEAAPDPALGQRLGIRLRHGSTTHDVTGSLQGGRLGGELQFRESVAVRAGADLDTLAADLADAFNAVHAAHVGLDGAGGRPLFTYVPGAAAAAIAVDPAIAADPSLLAAAAPPGAPGDNTGVRALQALADQPVAAGGRTLVEGAIGTLGDIGLAARSAEASSALASQRVTIAQAARDALSGVSLEDEMAKITGLQHAAEAATRFISVVDELMSTLLAEL